MTTIQNNKKYYYVVAGLPDAHLGQTAGVVKLSAFIQGLKEDLHSEDIIKLRYIFLPYDNINLLNICLANKKPLHSLANFSYDTLKSGIEGGESEIPAYLYEFYDLFIKGNLFQEDYIWEHQLNERFIEYVLNETEGFLKDWYIFARDLRNILAALSARYHGYSLDHQLTGKNDVTDKLKNSHAHDFNLSLDFPFIDMLIKLHTQGKLLELEKQIDFIRWNKIEQLTEQSDFSFDKIAGHVIKLTIIDKWSKYDSEIGHKVFTDKITKLGQRLNFSKEFAL
ncbi:MAG: DUF2764 family protein [Saprospiraceae bacterium]|nr:DUF2764 family protein [Saprospiraceae bacterium]